MPPYDSLPKAQLLALLAGKRCLNYTLKTRAKLFLGERISHETQESRGWHAGAKSGRRIGEKW